MNALAVANMALRKVGDKAISSFDQSGSTAARVCLEFFKPSVDEVTIEDHWSFAKSRAALVKDEVSENLTKYTYMYDLPAEALMVLGSVAGEQYEIEGTKLYSDQDGVTVIYLRSLVDESNPTAPEFKSGVRLPLKFTRACAVNLAMQIAFSLGKPEMFGTFQQEFLFVLRQAKDNNAIESPAIDEEERRWEEIQ